MPAAGRRQVELHFGAGFVYKRVGLIFPRALIIVQKLLVGLPPYQATMTAYSENLASRSSLAL
jgi:hypothetical protein